jgi:hypothetical protein
MPVARDPPIEVPMQDTGESEYFQRRAEEERAAADRAGDERAAKSHRALAKRYQRKADGDESPGGGAEPGKSAGVGHEFRIIP